MASDTVTASPVADVKFLVIGVVPVLVVPPLLAVVHCV
jgi:hypothetical protein